MEKQTLSQYQEFSEEKFTKRIIFKQGSNTAFLLNFSPGQELPPHPHPGSDVFIQMLQGQGLFIVDGEETAASQGDLIHCRDQEKLSFKNNGSEPVSLYVVISNIPSDEYAKNL